MALTTVSFTTLFNFVTKKFNFTDTTDYVSQAIAANDVSICFKIVDPLGNTLYNNTNFSAPDISPATSATNNLIPILLDSNGAIVQGQYAITATYQVALDTLYPQHTVTLTNTITLNYEAPTVEIELTANCVTPLLKSNDLTDYRVNGVTPTITRVHTIFYPAVLQLADLVGSGKILQTSTFYTNEHSSEVASTLTYNFTTYSVSDVVTGTATIDVVCDAQLCDIYCCIAAEFSRYSANKNTNKVLADRHLNNWIKMMSAAGQIGVALNCGKDTDVSNLTSFLLDLGNCQPGCGCSTGDPVPVVGLGGLGSVNVVVDTCGNGITVTPSTVGGTTTYSICLSNSIASKINNSYNTTLVAGTNITITSTADANGNIQYTVNSSTQTLPNIMTLRLLITNTPGVVATITEVDRQITGTLFKAPTYEVVGASDGYSVWKGLNNSFKVKDFLNTTQEIKATISLNDWTVAEVFTAAQGGIVNNASIIALDKTTGNGTVQFTFYAGSPDNYRFSNEMSADATFVSHITLVIQE